MTKTPRNFEPFANDFDSCFGWFAIAIQETPDDVDEWGNMAATAWKVLREVHERPGGKQSMVPQIHKWNRRLIDSEKDGEQSI